MNFHSVFFLFFALLTCGFALAVLFTSNVVRMAFYLVMSLGSTAALFFLAGADFVGSMQLMIYVGGTLVLLIFGVMLTAQSPFINMKTRGGDWIVSALVGGSLLAVLLAAAFSVQDWRQAPASEPPLEERVTTSRLALGLLGARADVAQQPNEALRPGMSGYLLPFEIVSVHLLVVLLGSAYLARAKRRRQPRE
ncbi:MAG: NADH-quinone oxidoreductase subunit J [Pirellulales bacterium]